MQIIYNTVKNNIGYVVKFFIYTISSEFCHKTQQFCWNIKHKVSLYSHREYPLDIWSAYKDSCIIQTILVRLTSCNTQQGVHLLSVTVSGHPVVYSMKLNIWIYKNASFQKGSYAYPSSAIILWSKTCIKKFLCVWVNKTWFNIWPHMWRKVYCFKSLWSERNDLISFVYKGRDTSFMTYHPPYKQVPSSCSWGTVHCNLNSNMVLGVGCPVLAVGWRHGPWNSLPMLRRFGGSPKLTR